MSGLLCTTPRAAGFQGGMVYCTPVETGGREEGGRSYWRGWSKNWRAASHRRRWRGETSRGGSEETRPPGARETITSEDVEFQPETEEAPTCHGVFCLIPRSKIFDGFPDLIFDGFHFPGLFFFTLCEIFHGLGKLGPVNNYIVIYLFIYLFICLFIYLFIYFIWWYHIILVNISCLYITWLSCDFSSPTGLQENQTFSKAVEMHQLRPVHPLQRLPKHWQW